MLRLLGRAGILALVAAAAAWAPAVADVVQPHATPTPRAAATTGPLNVSGYFRSYYFTRQNASNNPGAQFNFSSSKYSSAGVNQATLDQAIDLHADYRFENSGLFAGATYLYADPMSGACATAATHAKGQPCVTHRPPDTNPDDTVPGFILNTFYEAYVGYSKNNFTAKLGDQLFVSPWAGPVDTRLKPAAFQGGDFTYVTKKGWVYEAADMLQFQGRTSNTFQSTTLITSFPAGNQGMGANIYNPGGGAIESPGFLYGHVGYAPQGGNFAANGYLWGVTHIASIYWGDARYTWNKDYMKPYVALQGGWENNAGYSYAGKIASSLIGVQLGATVWQNKKIGNFVVAGMMDTLPWHYDQVALPKGVSCNNGTNQISAKGKTLAYFLPINAAQCFTNPNGTTTIAYGGWASPYTDNYATNPEFTTQISQGEADRRAPGTSWKIAGLFTAANNRVIFLASDAWFDYGNALASERTNEWDLDGIFRFSPFPKAGLYRGLQFRYRYAQRSLSNTFCGAAGSSCPTGAAIGSSYLGGLPLFKYNRAMLEYDF